MIGTMEAGAAFWIAFWRRVYDALTLWLTEDAFTWAECWRLAGVRGRARTAAYAGDGGVRGASRFGMPRR